MDKRVTWHIQDDMAYRDALCVYRVEKEDGRRFMTAVEMRLTEVEPGLIGPGPMLELPPDEAQQLMNELWRVGIRPKDGSGALAHVDAMKAHLADMRQIVFDNLGPKPT